MQNSQRQYECIVFGATGYTGKYTCEHIVRSLPTDFRWAVAGRSEGKLKQLVDTFKTLNPDRIQPGIEVAQLEKDELASLAKKTKVLITTVGPYHLYGTLVLEACAESGTHYLDVTGEFVWVYDMIQKYDAVAKRTGAIIIPQNGVESVPSDMVTWALVSHLRSTVGVGAAEVVQTFWDQKFTPSGGTMATVLSMMSFYSPDRLQKAGDPWSMAAVQPSAVQQRRATLFERLTGLRHIDGMGWFTDSPQGLADIPIVHRSWSLFDGGRFYGSSFHFSIYQRTQNALSGFAVHVATMLGLWLLALSPFRWLLKQFVYAPGEGPTKEQSKDEFVEWRAIAYAEKHDAGDPARATCRMRFDGSIYAWTGILVAEAALTIARDKTVAHELGGGLLTPATLGAPYLERLQKAGLIVEIATVPE